MEITKDKVTELFCIIDEFYKVSLEISKQVKNPKKILDLGAGTGLMSAFFFETYPEAEFTLVDLSEEMLNKAKDRFVNFSNFNYKVEDFSELNFETETFDLIILGEHHEPIQNQYRIQRQPRTVPAGGHCGAHRHHSRRQTTRQHSECGWSTRLTRAVLLPLQNHGRVGHLRRTPWSGTLRRAHRRRARQSGQTPEHRPPDCPARRKKDLAHQARFCCLESTVDRFSGFSTGIVKLKAGRR